VIIIANPLLAAAVHVLKLSGIAMNCGIVAFMWKINNLKDELTKPLAIHCRGEIGSWIAFVAVIVQLFFPQHFRGNDFLCFLFLIDAILLSATQYAG
jgi:hypothetical protein